MTSRIYWICLGLLTLLGACAKEQKLNLEPLSLTAYDLPVTIGAPEGAVVKTMTFGSTKDVSIKSGDGYYVQIFATDVRTADIDNIVSEQKAEVESERYFDSMVEERDEGFIYKSVIDSSMTSYGFRYVKVRGDYEMIFQQGLLGAFSLEDIQAMYSAVSTSFD